MSEAVCLLNSPLLERSDESPGKNWPISFLPCPRNFAMWNLSYANAFFLTKTLWKKLKLLVTCRPPLFAMCLKSVSFLGCHDKGLISWLFPPYEQNSKNNLTTIEIENYLNM